MLPPPLFHLHRQRFAVPALSSMRQFPVSCVEMARRGRLVLVLAAAFVITSLAAFGCGGGDEENGDETPVLAGPGEACPGADPSRCETGVHLIGDGGQCWCTAYCESSQDCPDDFPCQRYPFDGDQRDICAPACQWDEQCPSGGCDEATGECAPPSPGDAGIGDSCGDRDGICEIPLVCISHGRGGRCMETCELEESPLCESGAVCYESAVPDGGICWLGGALALDTPCNGEFDCVLGHVCVSHPGGQTCRPACDVDDPGSCEEGMGSCQSFGEGRLGACLP